MLSLVLFTFFTAFSHGEFPIATIPDRACAVKIYLPEQYLEATRKIHDELRLSFYAKESFIRHLRVFTYLMGKVQKDVPPTRVKGSGRIHDDFYSALTNHIFDVWAEYITYPWPTPMKQEAEEAIKVLAEFVEVLEDQALFALELPLNHLIRKILLNFIGDDFNGKAAYLEKALRALIPYFQRIFSGTLISERFFWKRVFEDWLEKHGMPRPVIQVLEGFPLNQIKG